MLVWDGPCFKGCLSRKQQVPAGLYCFSCVYASYVAGSVHLSVCLHLFVGGLRMRSVAAYHTMHRPIDRSDRSHPPPSLPPCLSVRVVSQCTAGTSG